MTDDNEHQSGSSPGAEAFPVNSLDQLAEITRSLLGRARRTVDIMSRDLDRRLYDDETCLSAIRRLATRHRRARIRVLARDLDDAIRHDHRLIELSRRLSSFIEIRRLNDDYENYNEAFLVVDGAGVVYRGQADRFEGWADFHHPLKSRELLKVFDDAWDRGLSDPNLRRLHL